MAQTAFRLLGPVAAHVDGRAVDLGGPTARAVLAVLLSNGRAGASAVTAAATAVTAAVAVVTAVTAAVTATTAAVAPIGDDLHRARG